jgi:hypothetical protein
MTQGVRNEKSPEVEDDRSNEVDLSVIKMFEIIASRNWTHLKAILSRKWGMSLNSTVRKCSGGCFRGCTAIHSILHYAFQFQPPFEVVKLLYKAYPNAVSEIECKERYPIHIACKHGCDPNVITFLIKNNPDAATKLDIKKRTPFVLALKSYVRKSNKRRKLANADLMQVVVALTEVKGMPMMIDDYKGISALEYTVTEELESDVYTYVQCIVEEKRRETQNQHLYLMSGKDAMSKEKKETTKLKQSFSKALRYSSIPSFGTKKSRIKSKVRTA